jgi:hypothetical protein
MIERYGNEEAKWALAQPVGLPELEPIAENEPAAPLLTVIRLNRRLISSAALRFL